MSPALEPGWTLVAAAGVCGVAGFMRGFVGVGSGMLMAPVFAILYGPLETVGMIILLELAVTAQLLPSVHRAIQWPVIVPMGVAAALCMPLGTWLLVSVDAELMARLIALVVLVLVLVLLSGWRFRGEKRLATTIAVGSTSGVLMAATSLGNPPVMLYLLSSPDSAATNRANFTGYFALTLVTLLAMMLIRELIAVHTALRVLVLLPVFALAAWAGARFFNRSGDRLYRRAALGLLLCVAIFGLVR
ncbi:MAG: sulfite exporter TauE/SafE family protein [Gammaproteobacteria bacterium]|nr:sulfite exporter TauE/SafE family protein [Gammaproteobacteria bacterium]